MAVDATVTRLIRYRATNICVSRGGDRILTDVSLTLQPGDAVMLRGPNGAGKTTLLRALAGLLRLDSGAISVEDAATGEIVPNADPVVHCGPLNATKSALSVDENLAFWAALYRAPKERIGEARAAFGLDGFAGRRAGALSTGLARRLGLARLIIAHKPIWLVDEPTASLDSRSADVFSSLVERHRNSGGAAVIATHDGVDLDRARRVELACGAAQ